MATSPTLTGRHYIVFNNIRILKAPLAQSVEHETFNLRAAGSSPAEGFSMNAGSNNIFRPKLLI